MGKRKNDYDNFDNLHLKKRPYVALPFDLLDSSMWQELSKSAQLSYINIRRCYNGFNSRDIICTRNKLVCKLTPKSWLAGTKELEEKGFIIVTRRSGQGHYPNIYSLSNNWKTKEKKSKK